MKIRLRIFLLAFLPFAAFSCKDQIEEIYTLNEPVYMTYDELRSSLKVAEEQDIIQPGKIYFKDDYIFVNEYLKGIHVIDNSDPASPDIVKFIEIPGNVDLSVKGNILYADSYVDLVAIDISDLENIREVKRIINAFPYIIPECVNGVIDQVDVNRGVVVGWHATEKKVNVEEDEHDYIFYERYEFDMMYSANSTKGLSGAGSGTGGSMARFTVYEDYLYTVNNYMLWTFDISTASDPKMGNPLYIGWNIETIFPYDQKLFIGGSTGMYIYSIANPANPVYVSAFWHVTSCDPVVVKDNYAYVTLRAGNLCGENESQLDVINIADITQPFLVKEYVMEEPYGLGIDGNMLFVCDGDAGLKIYDASNPLDIDGHMIAHYEDINAWDVIPLGELLIMIGTDGLYQYDYSDPENITLLSIIPIQLLIHPVL
jgi:hypothetical protein